MQPRFKNSQSESKPYFARKMFQIQMMNYFHKKGQHLPQQFLHETFFFVTTNAAALGFYFGRTIASTILSTCYASFVVLAYGQHVEFDKALSYDLPQSIYTRLLYRQKFNELQHDHENSNFIKRYKLAQ